MLGTILDESSSSRYVLAKPKYPKLFHLYQVQVASFWVPAEIDLLGDLQDWNTKLSEDDRHFIKMVLAFFASADGIVNENLALRFFREIPNPESRAFYTAQMLIESIHADTYARLLETYITDNTERYHLFDAIHEIPVIKKKAEWAQSYITSNDSIAERMIAFLAVEGIHFSGSFCAIFWLCSRGFMKGLAFSNQLISRDEGLHATFATEVSKIFRNEGIGASEERIKQIICSAVEVEKEFVREAIRVDLIGMSIAQMSDYIEYVADRTLKSLECTPVYGTKNPFPFMELISMDGRTNFIERHVSEYKMATKVNGMLGGNVSVVSCLEQEF